MDFFDIMPSIVAQHQMNEATRQAHEAAQEAFHARKRRDDRRPDGPQPGPGVDRLFARPPPTRVPGPGRSRSG